MSTVIQEVSCKSPVATPQVHGEVPLVADLVPDAPMPVLVHIIISVAVALSLDVLSSSVSNLPPYIQSIQSQLWNKGWCFAKRQDTREDMKIYKGMTYRAAWRAKHPRELGHKRGAGRHAVLCAE